MRFVDVASRDLIRDDLQSVDVRGIISELVDLISDTGLIDQMHKSTVVNSVVLREKLGSTGIGNGFAIPHAHIGSGTVVAFGRSKKGIDFDSIDGKPVQLIFLVLAEKGEEQLEALALIARTLRIDFARRLLMKAKDEDEMWETLVSLTERTGY